MDECFLKGFGQCRGQLSREHYISASVLEYLKAKGGFKIGGLAWQPPETLQPIGVGSLQSKVLCEGHNSGLSPLDAAATQLFQTLDAIDKGRQSLPATTTIDGLAIERWFLKVLCGLSASRGFKSSRMPEQWKSLLTGAPWPDRWGLYVFPPQSQQIFTTDLFIETMVNPSTGEIVAALFRVAGVTFYLLLGSPNSAGTFGIFHPRGLIFVHGKEERRIEFLWPALTNQAVTYRKVGTTKNGPPHRAGWNE